MTLSDTGLEGGIFGGRDTVEIGSGAKLAGSSSGGDIVELAFHQVAADHRAVFRAEGRVAITEGLDRFQKA